MDNNTPTLFIDSTQAEYLSSSETKTTAKHRTITYDCCLKDALSDKADLDTLTIRSNSSLNGAQILPQDL